MTDLKWKAHFLNQTGFFSTLYVGKFVPLLRNYSIVKVIKISVEFEKS